MPNACSVSANPILICAQSGRFLAQAAHRANHPVWVIDSYADKDTLAIADRYLQLTDFGQCSEQTLLKALHQISQSSPCKLILGTGIERFYPIIANLPPHIHYVGNRLETLELVCQPARWFALLSTLEITFPDTQTHAVAGYLFKASQSWGGSHIQLTPAKVNQPGYFQRRIEGISASVLFLADGEKHYRLSVNQQHCRNAAIGDFTLASITNSLLLPLPQLNALDAILDKLTQNLAIKGFNALDVVIDRDNRLYVLELNPRPSASMALLDPQLPLIDLHLLACEQLMPAQIAPTIAIRHLHFCFADRQLLIPEAFVWPDYCADLPADHSVIEAGAVICSLLLDCSDSNAAIAESAADLAQKLLVKLTNQT